MVGAAWSPRGRRRCCTAGARARGAGRLLEAVRGGQSRVLVVAASPGLARRRCCSLDGRVGVPGDAGGRCGVGDGACVRGLQQLCAPMLDRLDRLPPPQQDALGVAFGLRAGDAPGSVSGRAGGAEPVPEAAEEQPLVCVVDDAQWLDRASAQALVFVARRLLAESVALVFATRDPDELEGLPRLGSRVCAMVMRAPSGSVLRVRWMSGCGSGSSRDPRQSAGVVGVAAGVDAGGAGGRVRFADARACRGGSRTASAAGSRGSRRRPSGCCWSRRPSRSATRCWYARGRAARDRGPGRGRHRRLLTIGARVTFRHPLVRSAVYRAAVAGDRQAVHRALADATDPAVDPDRRAWHLAHATPGFDEDVASELERSAGRAQARGLARRRVPGTSDLLTPSPRRAERALAAAQAKHHAGGSTWHSDWWPSQSRARLTSSSAPTSTCCAHRSCSR